MKIHDVVQGSPEWLAVRAPFDCASDAPAMMGASSRVMRTDLVRMKATGGEKEFSQWVRDNLLLRGHEVEVYARKRVEAKLGEDLYPVTGSKDGLLASYDGVTIDDVTGFECKLWNEELAAAVRAGATELPEGHEWQLEQQLLVSDDMERIIFVCTDGTPEKYVEMEYRAVAGRAKQLKAGWAQFHEDVKNYVHVEVIPKAVANPVTDLPQILIDVRIERDEQDAAGGKIAIVSTLTKFGEQLRTYLAALPEKPATDQEFADLEQAVKNLALAEERLQLAETAALARFTTVEEMRSTVAMLHDLARAHRLRINKLVETRKKDIRDEIRIEGLSAFGAHLAGLNKRLGGNYMPVIEQKFADEMKGKKSVASLRDAVNTEVARLKILANEIADRIDENLKLVRSEANVPYLALFPDLVGICWKPTEDFGNLVAARIASHKAAAEEQARVLAERERDRIHKEEAAKLAVAPAAPAPISAPARAAAPLYAMPQVAPAPGAAKVNRPTDDHIVAVLADHFKVDGAEVIEWLQEMDLEVLAA